MNDAIDQGCSAGGVGEDGWPVAESQVGGEDDALVFVAAVDDFEKEVGIAAVVGQIADLVDAQEMKAAVVSQSSFEGSAGFDSTKVEQ